MLETILKIARRPTRAWLPYKGGTRLCGVAEALTRRYSKDVIINDFDGDLRFSCSLSRHMGAQIFWRGSYSGEQLAVLGPLLNEKSVFFDIGANQGEFTVFAAKRCAQVYAFEPVPENMERLQRNVQLNAFVNVVALQKGLSDVEGSLPIFSTADGCNEGIPTLYRTEEKSRSIGTIGLTTVDTFVKANGIARVDVLKVDVEGAELAILKGAQETIETHRPTMLLEFNADTCSAAGYTIGHLVDWLTSRGYKLQLITRKGLFQVAEFPGFCNVLATPA